MGVEERGARTRATQLKAGIHLPFRRRVFFFYRATRVLVRS